MTHPTDKELDALVERAGDAPLDDKDNCFICYEAASTIISLRTQLAEARAERDAMIHPDHVEGLVKLAEPMIYEALAAETARAERAEAALAAQIEADALVCDELAAACAMALALASNDTPEVRTAVAYSIKIAKRCAVTIRNQPHDRPALDRMLAKAREKVLREAASIKVVSHDGLVQHEVHPMLQAAILDMIEKP